MTVVQVRLDAPSEAVVRSAAKEMGVQINRVKNRGDCVQLYGTKVVDENSYSKEYHQQTQAEIAS